MCGTVYAIHAAPMFHGMGLVQLSIIVSPFFAILLLCVSDALQASAGLVLAVYRPASPPLIPTPDNFWDAIVRTRSELIACAPVFVQVCVSRVARSFRR